MVILDLETTVSLNVNLLMMAGAAHLILLIQEMLNLLMKGSEKSSWSNLNRMLHHG